MNTFCSIFLRLATVLPRRCGFAVAVLTPISVLLLKEPCVQAQAPATINPISYFEVGEENGAVVWLQSYNFLRMPEEQSIIGFSDNNGGTSAMTWGKTGTLLRWDIHLASGVSQSYSDGPAHGQIGGFLSAGGSSGLGVPLSINGHPYVCSGSYLVPGSAPALTYPIANFMYNGATYQLVNYGIDYLGRNVFTESNGSSTCTLVQDHGLQICFPDGTQALYGSDPTGRVYSYNPASTAGNRLTNLNGYQLVSVGDTVAIPIPITSFALGGLTFTMSQICFTSVGMPGNLQGDLYACFDGGPLLDAKLYINQNGTLKKLVVTTRSNGTAYTVVSGDTPGTYVSSSTGGRLRFFSAFNGIPYSQQGGILVPLGPVSGFSYGGNVFQSTGSARASNGNWITQLQAGGDPPQTATAEFSPTTGALVKLTINTDAGTTATYVDGASVGQPGIYVWSNTSTAANLLTSVNNNAYSPTGSTNLPGNVQTANGVFDVQGNFLSLGTWSNDASHVGFSLSYYDGQPATYSSNIEFTASRPLTSWTWDNATEDGTVVNAVMQVDETSRFLLYPAADPQATSPTLPAPTVVLDPNPGGISRFDGPVRISKQGDLEMGEFTSEPTPTPAQ